ncbi:hypothetical protein B9Z55_026778 [Caenorhabditis nigoni]|uniref:Uncharacterized protein n=1 Tax=Caenorhabditis nigoni TaxID=1611254 RepID=A0A2G5SHR6_9PELO|nr:hypothetical protein B9Z55_026778 [Caenorhabditis nigoni]
MLKKPTTRCLNSSSFQLYKQRLNGSSTTEGRGWTRMRPQGHSEEDYAPYGSQPKTPFILFAAPPALQTVEINLFSLTLI